MATGEYRNSKSYTGLDVDNFLTRASRSVTYNTGDALVANTLVFAKTDTEVGGANNLSSASGLLIDGYVQFKNSAVGNVKIVQQFYDGSTSLSPIVLDNSGSFSTPSSFTTLWEAREQNMVGAIIKFQCQGVSTPSTGVVYEQTGTQMSLSFSYNNKEYCLSLGYSSTTMTYCCYERVSASDSITVTNMKQVLDKLCEKLGITCDSISKGTDGNVTASFSNGSEMFVTTFPNT